MGADDYLAKKLLNPRELMARVRAVLRHRNKFVRRHHLPQPTKTAFLNFPVGVLIANSSAALLVEKPCL